MPTAATCLRRLRYETQDWCANVQASETVPPATHRDSITHHPEVWGSV